MPHKPGRPCRQPGCPELTSHRSGWCPEHYGQNVWRKRIAGTTHQRGYGWQWQKKRAALLATRPLCNGCQERGRVTLATEVDHIVPKARGGSDAWGNLQPLCNGCHKEKTQRDKIK